MKTKITKITIFLIILITAFLGTVNILKNKSIAAGTENRAVNIGKLAPGELNPNTYGYRDYCGSFWEARHVNSMPLPLPTLPGYQIYCSEHGVDAGVDPYYPYTYKEIEASEGKSASGSPCVSLRPEDGVISPIGYHAIGSGRLPVVAAYIISDSPRGKWTADKQRGLWNLVEYMEGLIQIMGHSANDGGSKYDEEGKKYYIHDNNVRNKGLNPTDQTLFEKDLSENPTKEELDKVVRVDVNQETGEYTVGPFKINYTNGIYGNITFSGITNMEVIGYNAKGEIVRGQGKNSAIKIDKFVFKNTVTGKKENPVTPDYFKPDVDKVDRTAQVYPAPGQEFYIVYKDPNANLEANDANRVAKISVKVDFKYMLANGEYTKYKGIELEVVHDHRHVGRDPVTCIKTIRLIRHHKQTQICVDAIRSLYEQSMMIGGDGDILLDTTMELGGHVWEDTVTSKETKADGVSNTTGEKPDIPLPNVKVTLYEVTKENKGIVATLMTNPEENGIDEAELMHRINSTYTDSNGNYLFRGLNPMRKYYVRFDYNGQTYLPTEYLNTAKAQHNSVQNMVNAGLYNQNEWKITSKGTESPNDRTNYDKRFEEIASYPYNYPSTNSLGQVGEKNAVFTKHELMGYELTPEGVYKKTGKQLIDGFEFDEKGLQTDKYTQGEITTKVREFINKNKKYPTQEELKTIYSQIAGGDKTMWQKLQFVEDCYIKGYTGSPLLGGKLDLYPVYNKFKINKEMNGTYDMSSDFIGGVEYKPIYPGQYYVNLGLWRRQEFDMALRKDVYKAALKINDKTVVYDYDKRNMDSDSGNNQANGKDNETHWDINVRMSDYDAYYGASYNKDGTKGYNREIYKTDYDYDSAALGHPGSDLEVYITYKITLRNQSMSIEGKIKEIVDHYDKEYTYKPNLSWIMFQTKENFGEPTDDEYYAMMEQKQDVIDSNSTDPKTFIKNANDIKATDGKSRYGNEGTIEEHKNLYIAGLEDKSLQTGEMAFIYLTFEVNKDGNGKIILDDESNPKDNIAEINGYSTYYRDGTKLPNNVTKGSKDIAGLLDRDSNPGNVDEEIKGKLKEDKYERYFEDDTDKAPAVRVKIDENGIRKANGVVWEDKREKTVGEKGSETIIGDGIRQEGEIGVAGVTVQLVEKCINGAEYIWKSETTGANGEYNFESYIPADYVIRFYYGDTVKTVLPNNKGGSNVTSYNGQDFKSTTYQNGIEQTEKTDEQGRYQGYINTEKQNVSGTYNPNKGKPTEDTFGYDIYASDSNDTNYSDAKDIWSTANRGNLNIIGLVKSPRLAQGRETVINYSSKGVTNGLAEILASPYESTNTNLHNKLMDSTYMTAETGVIVAEFEYNRQQTDLDKIKEGQEVAKGDNIYNGNYTLANIDLGLTERPKAQLEIDKSVENINVALANGTTLFDITGSANNALWQDHKEYNIDEKKIDSKDKNIDYKAGEIGMYEEYYGTNNRYAFRTARNGVNDIMKNTDKGLIQLTMDEELMHGATIKIKYIIKVTNVGEVDYVDGSAKNFYYKGDISGATVSTTSADQLIDYVQNNLQFEAGNEYNTQVGWNVINKNEILSQGLVNPILTEKISKFNNIIQTAGYNSALKPGQEILGRVVLSQLITPENTDDDLTYNNMVEIVKTSNNLGRRMAYSIVGNQDPTQENASEIDASAAEKVVILPPFGQKQIYYILGGIVGAILIIGIVLIIRKVLKKKKEE